MEPCLIGELDLEHPHEPAREVVSERTDQRLPTRLLVLDDVPSDRFGFCHIDSNAGSATRATYAELRSAGARPVAIAALLTLGAAVPAFAREHSLALHSLAALRNTLWEPFACPLCAAGVPLDRV